jgi:methionyl-tRNA formyltransferase
MELADLRIVYAANPAIAVPTLAALHASCTVVGVLCNPDRPAGRGKHPVSPAVKDAALALGLPVIQSEHLLSEQRRQIAALHPDVLVSFACGFYFGPKFLALFARGALNIHPSLLPMYRGCSPIQFALLEGCPRTGITVQRIAAEVDCGNVLAVEPITLDGTETSLSLTDEVAKRSGPLIVSVLDALVHERLQETVQDPDAVTMTRMLSKQDGIIDWTKSAKAIHSHVRAMAGWPKATTTYQGEPLVVSAVSGSLGEAGTDPVPAGVQPGTVLALVKDKGLAVACGDGILYVQRVQPAMKRDMDSASFVNGHPAVIGCVLGR